VASRPPGGRCSARRAEADHVRHRAGSKLRTTRDFELEWHELRIRLERHHSAEDDDLWPILRRHLTAADELHEVDRMIEEHRALATAIADVEHVLTSGADAAPAIGECHLSRAEWRGFLITERRKTPLRERHEFLGWVLDDADPADTAAVLSELPPPGRFVYRHMIRPRYGASTPTAKRPHHRGRVHGADVGS
jgi:hypothetical protein